MAISQQKVELLFVQNSTGIEYDKAKGTLRMKNIGRSTLFFTDRPVRMAGHYHTRDEFLPLWSEGPDSFAKNPPNATLSILEVGKADLQNAVINLKNPRMQGKDLHLRHHDHRGHGAAGRGRRGAVHRHPRLLAAEHPARGDHRDGGSGDDGRGGHQRGGEAEAAAAAGGAKPPPPAR